MQLLEEVNPLSLKPYVICNICEPSMCLFGNVKTCQHADLCNMLDEHSSGQPVEMATWGRNI